MRTRSVLVVDDEPAILASTRVLLEDHGFRVHATTDPTLIVPLLLQHRPQALLQDVRMPGLDLPALLHEIRGQPDLSELRVLLFTASLDAEELAKVLAVDGLVEKPFQPWRLVQMLGLERASV